METINMRTIGVIFSTGILLTSCVSSKKYHRSEAEVAKLRNDSTTLAQQSSSLQQNLSSMQQKNSDLQKTIENNTTANAGLTKNVAYYREYSDKQQATTTQLKTDVNTALASSGISDQDVILTEGKIYINVAEKNLFKGNTAVLTPKGRDLVNNIGQFVKSHDGVDVSVADLQEANMSGAAAGSTGMNGSSTSMSSTSTSSSNSTGGNNSSSAGMSTDQSSNGAMTSNGSSSRSRRSGSSTSRHSASTSSSTTSSSTTGTGNNDNTATAGTTDKTAHKSVAVHHRKRTSTAATSGEGSSMAYSSGHHKNYTAERSNRSMARAIAWKRQNVVTDELLKSGIPKVKVIAQNPNGTDNANGQKGVQVILVNNMDEFYKHMSEAPTGQPVSANP